MEQRGRKLTKKEQSKIVKETNTGQIMRGVGFNMGQQFPNSNTYSSKPKVKINRVVRGKQNG